MGKKALLAPRNSAEAVALGVSACFLAVAGVVVHGNSSLEGVLEPNTQNLAASIQTRTFSQPSPGTTVSGSRIPGMTSEVPLVLLPVEQQAAAKVAALAQGTQRRDGVILVAYERGAGTLSPGGGLSGIVAAPKVSSPRHPSGAVGFPTSTTAATSPGVVTAAPEPATDPSPTTDPTTAAPTTAAPSTPVETAAPTETTPPVETTTPPVETTPPTETTDPGPGDGGSTDPGTGPTDGSTGGSTGSSGSTDGAGTTDAAPDTASEAITTDTTPTPTAPGPTPQSGDV